MDNLSHDYASITSNGTLKPVALGTMNGLIYMYNPTTINGILRHTIITIIDIRYLLVSLVVRSGLFIYATFSITQSQYFFLISVRDYRTCILCIVWDISMVFILSTHWPLHSIFVTSLSWFVVFCHTLIKFFFIYTSYIFSLLWHGSILWKQNKHRKNEIN